MTRQPVAQQFYRGSIREQMETFKEGFRPPSEPEHIVAGIVPHAGWFFSGATAAKVFLSIHDRETPKTFVLLGAVHRPGVAFNSVYPSGSWETPIGPLKVDEGLSRALLKETGDILRADPSAHDYEHSIEVQTPMIKYLFPEAMIMPIAVPPVEAAVELGERLGQVLKREKADAVVIGSTDLTHYGANYGFAPEGFGTKAHGWMLENDQRIINLAERLDAEAILEEAELNMNACGPGAMAATVAAARELGAKRGHLLEHTTSYDVYPEGDFDMGVGYAGIIF